MKICGVIAEYNPFHNGHQYQIEKIKQERNAEAIISVMSGNFIQRGQPALLDKWTRTRMALENGVDLVIELPTYYATASAEYFAMGGVGLFNALGIVDELCFGANTDELDTLKRIANVLILEPEGFKKLLHSDLKRGASFPIARSNALKNFLKKEYDAKYIADILLDSNNILAIEYLKALQYLDSNMLPVVIKRKGVAYHSLEVVDHIASATAIREKLMKNEVECVADWMPQNCFAILHEEMLSGKSPMFFQYFEKEILYRLRMASMEELVLLNDVTEGLEYTLKKCAEENYSLEEILEALKTKRYTKTRMQRLLLSVLLNISKVDVESYHHNLQYIRVLGFTKTGEKLLSKIHNATNLPIVTNVAKFMKMANDTQRRMLEKDILATNIYTLGYQVPAYRKMNLDYRMPVEK